ncbi:MAG: sigma-70 family RNA polymerase sigma factor [Clostridia bacterium]|nr:sigma-70 family RNA polymerase sigma factor [Clostridia bacterium]MCI9275616.1 sigma-70 family RNA polymerase sigma factor [Clostridia bacterium]
MEEIYNRYSKLVYNYLKGLCGDSSLAEELTQETFYKAVKGIKKFNNECKVSTWLCQIAKNTWLDFLKKKKYEDFVLINDENYVEKLIIEKSIENQVEDKEDLINLYQNIHKLDENTREVFYLRLKGELSFRDIGKILNKSEDWARLAFYRGKIRLKEGMLNDKK